MSVMRSYAGGRLRSCVSAVVVIAASIAGSLCLTAQQSGVHAPAQDERNTDIVHVDTHLPLPNFTSLKAWEERKKYLRNQILVSAGLSPLPERSELHAQIFAKIEEKDYTIEKVLLETMPGFYLGGNLYRPRNGKVKHPGVLNPHGHWQYGRLENQPLYSGPSLGISLARRSSSRYTYTVYTGKLHRRRMRFPSLG